MRVGLSAAAAAAAIAVLESHHLCPVPAALALYGLTAAAIIALWHRSVRRVSRLAAILIVLLPLLFTGRALLTDRAYGPYDLLWLVKPWSDYAVDYGASPPHNRMLVDLILQITPAQFEVRRSLSHGEWPLWNPTMFSGHVLAGNAQSAPFDPINLIAFLLPPDIATTFRVSMTLFLAAFFAFACARELECSEEASLVAAAGFMCSNMMTFWAGWPLASAWTMLPFVLLAVRRVVRDRDLRGGVLLTTALLLLVLSGHPETALHVVAIGIVVGVFALIPLRREAWKSVAIAAGSGLAALMLAAIFLLPFAEAVPHSWPYAQRREATFVAERDAPPDETARAIRATFIPYSGGATWRTMTADWNQAPARVGSVVVALAIAAVFGVWRRRDVRLLLLIAVVALLASWKFAPVAAALHALPLFRVALNDRLGAAAALSLSLLAALAYDARDALWRPRSLVLATGTALGLATAFFWNRQTHAGVDPKLLVAGAAAEIFGVLMVAAALSTRSKRVAFALIIVGLIGQRVVEEGNIYPAVPRKLFFPSVPLIDAIPRDPLYRTIGFANVLVPNIGTMYGLEDIRGNDAMMLESYPATWPLWCPDSKQHYRDVRDLSRPFLNFLGVRYAIVPREMEPPDGWRSRFEDRQTRLLENTRAIPRVFVPRSVRYLGDPAATVEEMKAASDFADVAWIDTRDTPPHTEANAEATLNVQRHGSRYEIGWRSAAGSRLVVTEAAWPGWRAYIDGRRVKTAVANRSFLSVYVPAGTHHVRVQYLPDSFVRGRAITFATLATLSLLALALWWRKKTRRDPIPGTCVEGGEPSNVE